MPNLRRLVALLWWDHCVRFFVHMLPSFFGAPFEKPLFYQQRSAELSSMRSIRMNGRIFKFRSVGKIFTKYGHRQENCYFACAKSLNGRNWFYGQIHWPLRRCAAFNCFTLSLDSIFQITNPFKKCSKVYEKRSHFILWPM